MISNSMESDTAIRNAISDTPVYPSKLYISLTQEDLELNFTILDIGNYIDNSFHHSISIIYR